MTNKLITLIMLAALLLTSCATLPSSATLPAAEAQPTNNAAAPRPTEPPTAAPQQDAAPDAIDEAALANMTYQTEWTDSGEVTLVDGEFRDPPDSGTAAKTIIQLDKEHIAYGQVGGAASAAVVLNNGAFYSLALVSVQDDGSLGQVSSISLGEGVKIKGLSIDDKGAIVVNLMTRGPQDAPCCPTQEVLQDYLLKDGALVLGSSKVIGGIQPQEKPGLPPGGMKPAPQPAPAGLEREVLKNMTYRSEWAEGGEVKLENGELTLPAASGALSGTVIMLDQEHIGYGKIDGKDAAALILISSGGGTGTFYNLVVVTLLDDGTPIHLADAFVGDRVQIKSLIIDEKGEIVLNLVTHGPQDPMCCPTLQAIQRYTLDGKTLTLSNEIAVTPIPVATDELLGFTWMWSSTLVGGDALAPVTDPSQYTLRFEPDGILAFQADCNQGGGTYKLDGSTLTIELGVMTMVACGDESLSGLYLEYLADADSLMLDASGLHITLKESGAVMNFEVLAP